MGGSVSVAGGTGIKGGLVEVAAGDGDMDGGVLSISTGRGMTAMPSGTLGIFSSQSAAASGELRITSGTNDASGQVRLSTGHAVEGQGGTIGMIAGISEIGDGSSLQFRAGDATDAFGGGTLVLSTGHGSKAGGPLQSA